MMESMQRTVQIQTIQNVPLASILSMLSEDKDLYAVGELLIDVDAVPASDEGCFIIPAQLFLHLIEEELPRVVDQIKKYFKKNNVDLQGAYIDVSGLFM